MTTKQLKQQARIKIDKLTANDNLPDDLIKVTDILEKIEDVGDSTRKLRAALQDKLKVVMSR